jgi:hypothetical protein
VGSLAILLIEQNYRTYILFGKTQITNYENLQKTRAHINIQGEIINGWSAIRSEF